MKKSNILYIGNKLSKHGNTATSIETLGSFLEKEGYQLFYASSKKNKLFRMLDMVFKTIYYSKKINFVLIDVYSTQNFWYALFISQLCRILKLKYVAKLHGGDLPNRIANSPYFSDLIFNNAYKITAPSNYLLEAFSKKYSANLIYIPNTIQIGKYPFLERQITEPKLLWVRSFSSIYNPKMAINVLFELKKHYPNAQLCMVGPDKENILEECKKFAADLNLDVKFTGKLSKKRWILLSNEYNIFINTTNFDNTPISVIEAMSLGLPVVSTNVGGIPYMLENNKNAILVEKNNVTQMVNAIVELTTNKLLKNKIVGNARNEVELFDWQIVKHQWFEILK